MSITAFNKTVLIIDDDLILAELFDEILTTSFSTHVANNISEAIIALQSNDIDAVVSDYHLGDQNADVLIEWIRQERPELATRTILLTGERDMPTRQRGNVASVLFKPVNFDVLKQAVYDLFEQPQASQL